MSEASVIIDGVRSPLVEFGSPSLDEAVVFVHGNPGSSLDWERLARGVGGFGRAVAMDMPGFGAADKRRILITACPVMLGSSVGCWLNGGYNVRT
jgi:pimeloyl-ACP methyl ester carboxylesterase